MNISNKTVLVTGGGSGIGFEIAKLLSSKGNKVIITGRNQAKLEKAAALLSNTTAVVCDITDAEQVQDLFNKVKAEFGDLSILINNAGAGVAHTLHGASNSFEIAKDEMSTNYFSLVRMIELFLPFLKSKQEAAIINVSSIVAFVPWNVFPTYSATKAAVHSYTQLLRYVLAKDSNIRVFELMPPLVNTDFAKETGGQTHGMPPQDVATSLVAGVEKDEYEIHTGQTADLRKYYLSSPADAFKVFNPAS